MAGIFRVIKGVTASGVNGNIGTHDGDIEAAKIQSLELALGTRRLSHVAQGGILTYNTQDGSPIVKSLAGDWTDIPIDSTFNNKPSIAVASAQSIRAEVDRATVPSNSFTMITVMSVPQSVLDATTGTAFIFARANNAGDLISSLRITNTAFMFTPNVNQSTNGLLLNTSANVTANVPFILITQWNNETKSAKVYINDIITPRVQGTFASVDSTLDAGAHYIALTSRGNFRLVEGKYTDQYAFGEALTDTLFGQAQLQRVVSALKAHYGIA